MQRQAPRGKPHPGYLLREPVQSDPGHPWQLSEVVTPCRAAQGMIPHLDTCALTRIKLLLLLLDPHLAVNHPKAAAARGVSPALLDTSSASGCHHCPSETQMPPHHDGRARQAVPGWGNNHGAFCTPRAGQCPWLQLGRAEAPTIRASMKCSSDTQ